MTKELIMEATWKGYPDMAFSDSEGELGFFTLH
jgi:hypothetical protein